MRQRLFATLVVGGILATGCATDPAEPVEWRELASSRDSDLSAEGLLIFASAHEWQRFYSEQLHRGTDPASAPAVNFSREVAVAVSMGRQTYLGPSVRVASVEETDGSLRINVIKHRPTTGLDAISHPYTVIAMAPPDKPLEYVEQWE